jgi:hypothetical protein
MEKQIKRKWPELPASCPLAGAGPKTGTFYRFSQSKDPRDWHLHCEKFPDNYAAQSSASERCRWHAFSIYADAEDIAAARDRWPKFRKYEVLRFDMTDDMGVALQGGPFPSKHDWWPSDDFTPPPNGAEVVEL